MCTACTTSICLVFDTLVRSYIRDTTAPAIEPQKRKPRLIPLDVRNAPSAADGFNSLSQLIARAPGIHLSPEAFKQELAMRSGFGEAVEKWASAAKVPNGLARKIILTCAEEILRERGARPSLTLLAA